MEKKNWWLAPIVLLPYLILALMISLVVMFADPEFSLPISNENIRNGTTIILLGLLILYMLTAVCTISFSVKGIRKKWEPLQLAKTAMIVKLIQIPAYLFFGVCGFLCTITVFGTLITLLIFLVDYMILILTAILTATAAINGFKQGNLSKAACICFILLQFVFCLDVVVTIACYCLIRKGRTGGYPYDDTP